MAATAEGVRAKIARAGTHLAQLGVAFASFSETEPKPYMLDNVVNPATGLREKVVLRADPLPPEIPLIIGDAVHNLRSALDHLMRQLVIASGRRPSDGPGGTMFRIWKGSAAYSSGRASVATTITSDALDVLDAVKPYKGGNANLWMLHELDVIDKHRLILTAAAAGTAVRQEMTPLAAPMMRFSNRQPVSDPVPLVVGAVLGPSDYTSGGVLIRNVHRVGPIIAEPCVAGDPRADAVLTTLIQEVSAVTASFVSTPGFDG